MVKTGAFDTEYFINLDYIKLFCRNCRAVITANPADHGQPLKCHSCSEFLIIPKSRFAPSIVINDFVLEDEIGSGGCGTVFLAYQISLDRYCALKILHNRILSEEKYLHELMQEGRVAGRLNHPNIVQCYSIGEEDGIYFYAMEYVEGKSVKDLLNERYKINAARSIDITVQIINALNYAWNKERLVHRDVKPDNIMINIDGEAKLTDMGLAIPAHSITPSDEDFIKGSPQYISPEQIMDEKQDFRSDIYSLGTVVFRMLTGHFVFNGSNAEEICKKHIEEKPASPAKYSPEIPPELCRIVLKMLAKKPENRYVNYESLKKDLLEVREYCDTHTASQEIIQTAKPKTRPPVNVRDVTISKESSPLHWVISISALTFFTFVSYWFIIRPVRHDAKTPESMGVQKKISIKSEPLKLEPDLPVKPESKPFIPPPPPKAELYISAILPDPQGYDPGNEWVEITNKGDADANLNDWKIIDQEKKTFQISGTLPPGVTKRFILPENSITLNNKGDHIELIDKEGKVTFQLSYTEKDVSSDQPFRARLDEKPAEGRK